MKTKIIKIGNSKGIRIPKSFINESGLKNEVELELGSNGIIIKPVSKIRDGWDKAFQEMSQNNDDVLLDSDSLPNQTKWDETEWEW